MILANWFSIRFLAALTLTVLAGVGLSACINDNYAGGGDCAFVARANGVSLPDGLGVNIHFTAPAPGEVKMIAEAGFRWVRMDFKWDATETEKGRYDFTAYERLLRELEAYKIRALFILDYGNPLYDNGAPPRTEHARQAFTRWAVAAAKHFKDRRIVWEIYNEPNHSIFWPPKTRAEEYVALALSVGRAFRAEVPTEDLIGPAVSEMDYDFIEACLKAGLLEYWSAVSVHPYLRTNPEAAALEYCRLRRMINEHSARTSLRREVQIVSSEWGYSSQWRGMNDQKQAEVFAREMLTNAAHGIPVSIWYDWRDDGPDPNDPEHHFGVVRNEYHSGRDPVYDPKPAYYAAQTLKRLFEGYVFDKRLEVGSESDYVLLFKNNGALRIAAWSISTNPRRVTIPLSPGQFRITSHTGEDRGLARIANQQLEVELSPAPIYLIPKE